MEKEKCCLNCQFCYEQYGYTLCKKHDETMENEKTEFCEDYRPEIID